MDVITTYLPTAQLFVINGVIEGLVSLICIFNPKLMANTKKLHKHGQMFAGFMGPMLFAMSFISILMAKVSADNEAKQLFAVGWLLYHCGAGYTCLKQCFAGKRAMIGGLMFHSFMLSSFGLYLKIQNFDITLLIPFF